VPRLQEADPQPVPRAGGGGGAAQQALQDPERGPGAGSAGRLQQSHTARPGEDPPPPRLFCHQKARIRIRISRVADTYLFYTDLDSDPAF
jgi:hypothetical protein